MAIGRILRVLALEPYFGLSHKTFLEGYRSHSRHQVEIWSLPATKWKWRMRGGAWSFAETARGTTSGEGFDVILASDFLNLPDWRALAPPGFRDLPVLVYFHENQITYPLGREAPVDFHYGWINASTALAADRILFNSENHRRDFLAALGAVLRKMPDHIPERLLESLPERSAVFPVGIDFRPHDLVRAPVPRSIPEAPVIFWNHRWEYDKGPDLFFETLIRLRNQGIPFRLVVCGQSFQARPPVFDRAREALADRIDHFGFFENTEGYLRAAAGADIVVSTAVNEFFGVSVIEAVYLGCLPVLPRRLSYPEIIPAHLHQEFLYADDRGFPAFLAGFLRDPPWGHREELHAAMGHFGWNLLAPVLDRELEVLAERGHH